MCRVLPIPPWPAWTFKHYQKKLFNICTNFRVSFEHNYVVNWKILVSWHTCRIGESLLNNMVPRNKHTEEDRFANKNCSDVVVQWTYRFFESKIKVQVLWYSSVWPVCQNCCPDDSWRLEGADVAVEVWSSALSPVSASYNKPNTGCWCIVWLLEATEEERFLCTVLHPPVHWSHSPPFQLLPHIWC